jgi:hypothetical protein
MIPMPMTTTCRTTSRGGEAALVIPYTLDNNDMKFAVPPGFGDPDGFERHLRDAFDLLLEEGGRAARR